MKVVTDSQAILIISETVSWQEPDADTENMTSQLYWDGRECIDVGAAGQCSSDFVNGGSWSDSFAVGLLVSFLIDGVGCTHGYAVRIGRYEQQLS